MRNPCAWRTVLAASLVLLLSCAAAAQAPAPFLEREVVVVSGEWRLPATLTLPRHASAAAPVTVAVLVHGSGPHDRDQSIGPNKPLRDLAHGLARRGVAALRYEKRSYAYAGRLPAAQRNLDFEVVDDAVAAIALAGSQPEVRADAVFVVGHSLGGFLAPRIARASGQVAGVVMLGAPARPVDRLVLEQLERKLRAMALSQKEAQPHLAEVRAAFAAVASGAAADGELVLGMPAAYWRDWLARDLLAEAAALPLPALVLQGARDYQVTVADYKLLASTLARRAAPTEHLLLEELNHLFMVVRGHSTGAEYAVRGRVDERVPAGIAAFIHRHTEVVPMRLAAVQ